MSPNMATAEDFDQRFKDPNPSIHFQHLIDAKSSSLTVKIHGLQLTQTFRHQPGTHTSVLKRKTTGLLAAVHGKRRIALS